MKYIRAKDGRIGEFYQDQSFTITCSLGCVDKKDILKQADTIEELCDWFIVEGDDNEITYHKTLFSAKTDGKDYILESNEAYTIYGCVLVKGKGLIYVAKMNEKGELELL